MPSHHHSDIRRTLLFLKKGNQVLLAMKKRGFGEGKWNGVGGKLEPGETIEQALIRECQEEIDVTPTNYWPVAELDFTQDATTDPWHMYGYVYLCDAWDGKPRETEEMAPRWYDIDSIPYEAMWDDDKYWLERALRGEKLVGIFTFDENDQMINHSTQVVKKLPHEE
jgi:mutator protein MutT